MRIATLAAAGGLLGGFLVGQEYRGTFSGSVTDPQGAAVPKAVVVAIETRTGVKSTAICGDTGAYSIPFLAPGEYEISAEAPGFKRAVRQGLTLSAGEKPVIDIRMDLGAVNESVTVSAAAPMIVSSTATLGQVVTTQEVEDIPINGRSPVMMMTLAMGVLQTNQPGPIRPFDQPGGGLQVAGVSGNEFLMDGAPNANTATGAASAYSPPEDAVTEVAANASQSDAAYGHAGGGMVDLITKSGTNSLHGSASEFNQASAMDANSFFANKAGTARPAYHYNQYGLTVGGPLWIPKVFNGKNRVFWFFGYEGIKDSDPATSPLETGNPVYTTTVPTAAERQGDFSALLRLNAPNVSYIIYDPYSGVASGSQVARTPYPNNVIPSNLLNPIAQSYLKLLPLPNIPGQANGFANYTLSDIDSDAYDNELGRLDINVSDKHRLWFDARHNYRYQTKDPYFNNVANGYSLQRINQGASLDDVYSITPSLLMDIRGNWTRFITIGGYASNGFDPTSLGFPSYIAQSAAAPFLPPITFTTGTVANGTNPSFQPFEPNGSVSNVPFDSIQLFGYIVKIRGNHSTKIGVDIREYRAGSEAVGNANGAYTFQSSSVNSSPSAAQIAQSWTNGPLNNAAPAPLGQDLAAFLLGLPSSGSIDKNARTDDKERYYAIFVQDDWRVRNNLTINLGLRFEHETPTTERYNQSVDGFNPTATNPVSALAATAYAANPIPQIAPSQFQPLGGLTFASAANPNIYHSNSSIFSPRFGIAWTPRALGSKYVIRSGFGVFVSPNGTTGLNSEGFSQTTQMTVTNNNYLSPAATLSNPFPNGILAPSGSSLGAGTFLGQQVTFFGPQARNTYSMRWDFGIQRELPGQLVLEVAYIGNHAVHVPITTDQLDAIPQQYLSKSPVRDNGVINLLTGNVPNPFKGLLPNSTSLNGSTVALGQLLVPYPQYPAGSGSSNGVIMQGNYGGESYYNSLNVRLQKRLTHGLTLINNIVWSNFIERVAYLNDYDPAPEKRIGTNSRPFREIMAASYELPTGHGKHFDLHSRIGNTVIGGWALNGTLTLESGAPIAWGNVIYYGGPLNLQSHQPNGLTFNTSDFNTIASQQLADNVRTFNTQFGNLRADPTKNLDLSLLKRFSLGEARYFQLRFETFNTTNRVTFSAPNVTPTSSTFGMITAQANTPRRLQVGGRIVW
jgi:hypothetical protein